jgi:hypothetical protein
MEVTWDKTPKSTFEDRKSDIIQSVRAGAVDLALHAYNSWNKYESEHSKYHLEKPKPVTLEDMYFKGEIRENYNFMGGTHGHGYMVLSLGEGDEGGPADVHVIWEADEHQSFDYKGWHAKGAKGKPKSLGFQISWTIRILLWDFDTIIEPIYNSTTGPVTDGVHNPWLDKRIPPMEVK